MLEVEAQGGKEVDEEMKTRWRAVALVGLTGAVIATGLRTVSRRHEERLDAEIERMLASVDAGPRDPVTEEDLAALPPPVQRWLRASGVVGRPIPTTVRLRQEGELRLGGGGWIPFTAQEYYSTSPPAFVWRARITMAPRVVVAGKDSFLDGHGELEMRAFGAVPVARDSGPEMDEADLLRFLNEIMWFPAAALLPEITWEPVDDESACATMSVGGVSGSATFFVDADGRLTDMVADRFDRDSGSVVPWSTPVDAYGEFGGVRVPISGEAVYARATGDHAYIRVRITDLDYNVPRRY